jgi:hypothetical protein
VAKISNWGIEHLDLIFLCKPKNPFQQPWTRTFVAATAFVAVKVELTPRKGKQLFHSRNSRFPIPQLKIKDFTWTSHASFACSSRFNGCSSFSTIHLPEALYVVPILASECIE